MKKLLLCLMISASMPIMASGSCGSRLSNIENTKADYLAYDIFIDQIRSKVEKDENRNNTLFGDFFVNDQELEERRVILSHGTAVVSLKKAIYEAALSSYTSCLILNDTFISEEEMLNDVDQYQVELLKNMKLLEIIEGM